MLSILRKLLPRLNRQDSLLRDLQLRLQHTERGLIEAHDKLREAEETISSLRKANEELEHRVSILQPAASVADERQKIIDWLARRTVFGPVYNLADVTPPSEAEEAKPVLAKPQARHIVQAKLNEFEGQLQRAELGRFFDAESLQ